MRRNNLDPLYVGYHHLIDHDKMTVGRHSRLPEGAATPPTGSAVNRLDASPTQLSRDDEGGHPQVAFNLKNIATSPQASPGRGTGV